MKTRPYRRGLLIYPPHCALLFITADERLQGFRPTILRMHSRPSLLCCRRRIFDSWVLLDQRCTALKAFRLMSRFITASPPLLMLATWWFITVLQSRSTLITSRFIRLGVHFAVVLYYRFCHRARVVFNLRKRPLSLLRLGG